MFTENKFDALFQLYKLKGSCDPLIAKQFYSPSALVEQINTYLSSVQILHQHLRANRFDEMSQGKLTAQNSPTAGKNKYKKDAIMLKIGAKLQQKIQAIKLNSCSPPANQKYKRNSIMILPNTLNSLTALKQASPTTSQKKVVQSVSPLLKRGRLIQPRSSISQF